jgi:spore coat-associated protein N
MTMPAVGALRRVTPGRLALAGGVAIGGLALTGMAVFAGLNASATNTTAQSIDAGTLQLTYADNGAGFTSVAAKMAPGDVVNRYVDLTNGGTLDGKTLTLAATDATPTKLSTDATNGLQVSVTECTGGTWNTATGVCSGTTGTPVTGSLQSMASTALSLASNVTSGATLHYQVSVALPDQNESVVNGALPVNTIQGLTADITWTFNELQRTATTTNS